jgi:hypothetical protein
VTGAHLRAVLVGVAVAVLAACGGPAPGAVVSAAAPATPVESVPPPAATSPTAPVELDVPAIGVHAEPLLDLGIDTADPELRLITCGGAFDSRSGHYQDNVVAYARLVRVA